MAAQDHSVTLQDQLQIESDKLETLTSHFSHLQHTLLHSVAASKASAPHNVSPNAKNVGGSDADDNRNQTTPRHSNQNAQRIQEQLNFFVSPLDTLIKSSLGADQQPTHSPTLPAQTSLALNSAEVTQLACSPLLSRLSAVHRAAVTPTAGAAQTVSPSRAKFLHQEKVAVLRHQWETLLGRKLRIDERPWETPLAKQEVSKLVSPLPPPPPPAPASCQRVSRQQEATSTPESPLRLSEQQMAWMQTSASSGSSVKHIKIPDYWSAHKDMRPRESDESATVHAHGFNHAAEFNSWLSTQLQAMTMKPKPQPLRIAEARKVHGPKFSHSPIVHAAHAQPLEQNELFSRMLQQQSDYITRQGTGPEDIRKEIAALFARAEQVREHILTEAFRDEYLSAGRVDALNTRGAGRQAVSLHAQSTAIAATSPKQEFTQSTKDSLSIYAAAFGDEVSAETHISTTKKPAISSQPAARSRAPSILQPGRQASKDMRVWNRAVRECADEVFALLSTGWYAAMPDRPAVVVQPTFHETTDCLLNETPLKGLVYFLVHRATMGQLPAVPKLSSAGRKLWESLSEEAALLATGIKPRPLPPQITAAISAAASALSKQRMYTVSVPSLNILPAPLNRSAKVVPNRQPSVPSHVNGHVPAFPRDTKQLNSRNNSHTSGNTTPRQTPSCDGQQHPAKDAFCLELETASPERPASLEQPAQQVFTHKAVPSDGSARSSESTPTEPDAICSSGSAKSTEVTDNLFPSQPISPHTVRLSGKALPLIDISSLKEALNQQMIQTPLRFGYSETVPAQDPRSSRATTNAKAAVLSVDDRDLGTSRPKAPFGSRRASTGSIARSKVTHRNSSHKIQYKKTASLEDLKGFADSFDHSLLDGINSEELLEEVLHACDDVDVEADIVLEIKEQGHQGAPLQDNSAEVAQSGASMSSTASSREDIQLATIDESDDDSDDAASSSGASTKRENGIPNQAVSSKPPDFAASKASSLAAHKQLVEPRRESQRKLISPARGDTFAMARKQLGLQNTETAPVRKLARMYSLAAKSAIERQSIVEHARRVVKAREQAKAGQAALSAAHTGM